MATTPNSSALTAEGTAAYRQQVDEAASILRNESPSAPAVGILKDTEVGEILDAEATESTLPCADIPRYPASGGVLTTGVLAGTRVVVMDQHQHLYEGSTPREVAFPVRMLAAFGVDTLLLPTTAGGVNPQFERGSLMLLTDHINFQGQNPLVGPNVDAWGPRFPDMTEPYDAQLQQIAEEAAREEGLSLQKGVYLALLGPGPETRAEHRMARRLGADAVGAGVVPEVIAARHMDVRVIAVALLAEQHLKEDQAPARRAGDGQRFDQARSHLRRLLTGVVARMDADGATA
ncbi:MAG: purine-nucleoside phosphorylase [Salinibacter sp.]|uniref:purine-nucleoside phosphorylase n=1 Tax=Salinibacter sp. TaxID=2065818 RepID=UPI0035D4A997